MELNTLLSHVSLAMKCNVKVPFFPTKGKHKYIKIALMLKFLVHTNRSHSRISGHDIKY